LASILSTVPKLNTKVYFCPATAPLVRVIQEALIRDVIEREHGKTKRQAQIEV